MIYATWKLSQESNDQYSGPEDLLRSAGVSVNVIFATPAPQTFLAIIDIVPMGRDLSKWEFSMLSAEDARKFVNDNALKDIPEREDLPFPATSIEDLLSLIV